MLTFNLFLCSLVWINDAINYTTACESTLEKNRIIFGKFGFQCEKTPVHYFFEDEIRKMKQFIESIKVSEDWERIQSNGYDNKGFCELTKGHTGSVDLLISAKVTNSPVPIGLFTLNGSLVLNQTSKRTDAMLWQKTNRLYSCASILDGGSIFFWIIKNLNVGQYLNSDIGESTHIMYHPISKIFELYRRSVICVSTPNSTKEFETARFVRKYKHVEKNCLTLVGMPTTIVHKDIERQHSELEQLGTTEIIGSLKCNQNSAFETKTEKFVSQILISKSPKVDSPVMDSKNLTKDCLIDEKFFEDEKQTISEKSGLEKLRKIEKKLWLFPNDSTSTVTDASILHDINISESLTSRKHENQGSVHFSIFGSTNITIHDEPRRVLNGSIIAPDLRPSTQEKSDNQYYSKSWEFKIFDADKIDMTRKVNNSKVNTEVMEVDVNENMNPNKNIAREIQAMEFSAWRSDNIIMLNDSIPKARTIVDGDGSTFPNDMTALQKMQKNDQTVHKTSMSEAGKYCLPPTKKPVFTNVTSINESSELNTFASDRLMNNVNLTNFVGNRSKRTELISFTGRSDVFPGEFTVLFRNSTSNVSLTILAIPSPSGKVSIVTFDAAEKKFVKGARIQMPGVLRGSPEKFIKSLYLALKQIDSFALVQNRRVRLTLDNVTIFYKIHYFMPVID